MRQLAAVIANCLGAAEMLNGLVVDAIPVIEKVLYLENTDAVYAAAHELIAKMANQK